MSHRIFRELCYSEAFSVPVIWIPQHSGCTAVTIAPAVAPVFPPMKKSRKNRVFNKVMESIASLKGS